MKKIDFYLHVGQSQLFIHLTSLLFRINTSSFKDMLNTADTINILSEIDAWYFFSLQDLFIDASSALFTATDNRAFFKEVTILVPQSWKNVQGIEVEAATTESLNKVPSADSIMIKWGITNKKKRPMHWSR